MAGTRPRVPQSVRAAYPEARADFDTREGGLPRPSIDPVAVQGGVDIIERLVPMPLPHGIAG